MKIIKNSPTFLLALIYFVFGLNYFFHFIPMPPMEGDAGSFMGLLFSANFLLLVKVIEIIGAILLVWPKTRALALLLIAPISINILLFELLFAHQPGIGIFLVLANALAIVQNKEKYRSILPVGQINKA